MILKNNKKLMNSNSYGGFDVSRNEYVIFGRQKTPMPWINICANHHFGTLITEGGAMFSWYKNSSLFRITPRIDDAVLRNGSELIYLKDEATGEIWQPTKGSEARHGKGYSTFKSVKKSLQINTTVLVSLNKPLKMIRLDITNNSLSKKIISATNYNQLVLGEGVEKTKKHIRISHDSDLNLIQATNPTHPDFGNTNIYLGVNTGAFSFELDRLEFFGRKGDITLPAALQKFQLPSKNIFANDPCAAISSLFKISPGETKSIIFFMSVDNKLLTNKKITTEFFDEEYQKVHCYWYNINSAIEISTPNAELDILFNKQLLYQTLSSRLWARTGFYQPGGAYGYRDQLQDVIALCWAKPQIAKKHILKAASRQFVGGGVQQWWHPPGNAGIRSQSSDAHLWLVYATIKYIKITGDIGILKEKVPFLLPNKLESQEQHYFSPLCSEEESTLYEHCEASLNRTTYLLGEKGLPLILSGDWNDSINLVGKDKLGESVWLAIFLAQISSDFSSLAKEFQGSEKEDYYIKLSEVFKKRVEEKCWDGEWYLRAFWDSGEKLGSKENNECKIDSLPQSWAIITGLDLKKSKKALNSANNLLVDTQNKVVKLFDPPFEKIKYDPGYVLMYPPGVRENGGAYTHAAAWMAQANAIVGQGDMAMQIVDYVNPFKRVRTDNDVKKYRGEPYVIPADIYTAAPYTGIAGWTWYTGSASVLYVIILENILGLKVRGDKLYIKPSVPKNWSNYNVKLKHKKTIYYINFVKSRSTRQLVTIKLDGNTIKNRPVNLKSDGEEHKIQVTFKNKG